MLDKEYVHFDMDPGSHIRDPLEYAMESMVGKVLCDELPGYSWHVECEKGQGLLTVRCPSLYQMKHRNKGFLLDLSRFASQSELKKEVIHAGHELVERVTHTFDETTGRAEIRKVDVG
jgi:hypothetical protein